MDIGESSGLRALVTGVRERAAESQKTAERIRKACDALTRERMWAEDVGALTKAATALSKIEGASDALEQDRAQLLAAISGAIEGLRDGIALRVLNDLRGAAVEAGMRFEMVGESPPTVLLPPFTVDLEVDDAQATLRYAREKVVSCALAGPAILAAHDDAKKAMSRALIEPEAFFDLLDAAYQVTVLRQEKKPGERVDIVDLLLPLGALASDPARWRKVSRVEPLPRYRLAHQLSQLRRRGCLERRGRRVELGSATGGSTRNKRNVLYIPTGGTEGQYYLTIRVSPV